MADTRNDTPTAIPETLVRRLEAQYGAEVSARILTGFEARHPTTLRANALKADRAVIARQLDDAGIAWDPAPAPALADAFVLHGAREDAVRELPAYSAGELYLQSLSAMLPALALGPRPGENILDMAAAPGGKTCQMAALSGGGAFITACEKNHVRAERLRYNLARQGAARVTVMECDARKLDEFFRFDKILLDAPCSGSGTVQAGPGARKCGFSDELLARSVKTQQALLRRALDVLAPGGVLVYATCSILADENDDVKGIRCIKMELGEPDASGRRRPIEVPGSEFDVDVDCVIMALGTSPNPLIKSTTKGLEINKKGGIVVNEDGLTSRENVYAGGDAVTGAATVILAMGAGKTAAKAIDEALSKK